MPRIRTWLLICCLSYLPSDFSLMSRAISSAPGTPGLLLPRQRGPCLERSLLWIARQVPAARLLSVFLASTSPSIREYSALVGGPVWPGNLRAIFALGAVVRDPPSAAATARQTPGIDQLRVGNRGHS